MKPNTIEAELLELERQYWQAMQDRDVGAAAKLTEFPCIVADSSGKMSVDRHVFEQMMRDTSYHIRRIELDPDAEVRLLTSDVAILAYTMTEEVSIDGKKVTIEAAEASTWVRRNGQWRCALHTESIQGDPWGRDRLPPAATNKQTIS
jgi:hypothetical protein